MIISSLVALGSVTAVCIVALIARLLFEIAMEVRRAARQASRITRIVFGKRKSKQSFRRWWKAFKADIFTTYAHVEINGFELPYDSRNPVRRCDHWAGG